MSLRRIARTPLAAALGLALAATLASVPAVATVNVPAGPDEVSEISVTAPDGDQPTPESIPTPDGDQPTPNGDQPTPADTQAAENTCTPTGAEPARILYFQDAHEFTPVTHADGQRGGIARLATVIGEQSGSDESTDIVFGGDLAGGTLFGGVYRGTPFVEAFNLLGVDVANFGQHDFDFGADHTRTLVAASEFTWVSSNLTTADGAPFVPATSLVRQVGGVSIGYLGLTAGMNTTAAAGEIVQGDFVTSARAAVADLQAQGVDLIVAVTQLSAADSMAVMNSVPEIGLLLREESAAASLGSTVYTADGRPIIEPRGDYGTVIRVDATPTTCGITLESDAVLVNGSVAEDADMLVLQNQYVDSMNEALAEVVSSAPEMIRQRPEMGDLVADAFREYTGADLAWLNGGGSRASLQAGDVTLRSLLSILPFDNKLMTIEVTGEQLLRGLEQGADSSPSGSGGYPRPSGFDYSYVPSLPSGSRIVNAHLDDGTPISPSSTYTLTLTAYVVNGGNGVTAFADAPVLWAEGVADVQALISYARVRDEIVAGPARALVLDTAPVDAGTIEGTVAFTGISSGVTVPVVLRVFNADGVLVQTSIGAANREFSFSGLDDGTYTVRITTYRPYAVVGDAVRSVTLSGGGAALSLEIGSR